jgi:hypothetical protein
VLVDRLAVRLRPRTPMEAADLGVRLCQSAARSVYPCYGLAALPVAALALASGELASWLPPLVLWCAKPWLDRTILFVLSRAAFGQTTTPSDVWKAQRQVWWSQFLFTWTVRRLSLWRSLTQPVYQLEDLSIRKAGARVRQIRQRTMGSALMMTQAFNLSETALMLALVSLVFWLAPAGRVPGVLESLSDGLPGFLELTVHLAYAMAVVFLEPFYVAAGFAMYLNRRAELEAWDIEQEFRRAFAH